MLRYFARHSTRLIPIFADMSKTYFLTALVSLLSFFSGVVLAQEVTIELGPKEIGLNETFTIKLTMANEKIKSYDQFPDIPGFEKQGISQSSSMNLINGQMSSSNSIIQYYKPTRIGTSQLPPFDIIINGNRFSSVGQSIKITEAKSNQGLRTNPSDPFADFFGRTAPSEPEFVELDDDAFFSLSVDKPEIYAGEGFTMNMAFYMSEDNRAPFQFYEPGRQLDKILKEVKPTNAWEENYNITNIEPEKVMINGKEWVRYKVYEATFFPFAEGEIKIPTIAWEMIKYRVAKNPTFFGANRQEDFKTFYSAAKTIKVKPLPPHPLRNEVSVGEFQLRENIQDVQVETGQGFDYSFGISGVGNINSVSKPESLSVPNLTTYDPNVRQQINRGYGRVSGIKEFNYYITINEAGDYGLADQFQWIYFDPKREVYDTLRSNATIKVVGESKVNESISNLRLGGIYDRIAIEDNRFSNEEYKYYFAAAINGLLLLVLIILAILIIRRK